MLSFPQALRESHCLPFSDSVNALSLAASTAETLTIPAGAKWVFFSATGNFYVKANGTAEVPGDVTDGSAAVLNPTGRYLGGTTSLSIIAPFACVVTAQFFGE